MKIMNYADDDEKEKQLINRLHEVVSGYLNEYVLKPSMETIETDIIGQARLAKLVFATNHAADLVNKEGLTFDKEYLRSLSQQEINKRIDVLSNLLEADDAELFKEHDVNGIFSESSTNKFLLPYLQREINWIAITILSSSYISSLVLMRAVFILLIRIATKQPESLGMSGMIDKIEFLVEEEKANLKKLWRRLNGWSHPYGKWTAEVCPIFVAHKPLYHSKVFDTCLRELTELVDFFITITISKYEVSTESLQHLKAELNESLSDFQLLASRI